MAFTSSASIVVNVAIQSAWNALTDPKIVKQYFFGTNVETDWNPGSTILFKGEWQGKAYEDKGTILSFEPLKRLSYNYWSAFSGVQDTPETRQIITYNVESVATGTKITVDQANVDTQERADHSAKNWEKVLSDMKKLLEAGPLS